MFRWPHLIAVGFLLFTVVTGFIATLGLNTQVIQYLGYMAITGYGLGVVGMAVALSRAGSAGRLIIALIFGLGTASVAALFMVPRLSVQLRLPF